MMQEKKSGQQLRWCCILASLLLLVQDAAAQQLPAKEHAFAVNSQQYDSIVYQTRNLIIRKLSTHIYVHTSYLQTSTYGRVDCNGMIVINEGEAIIFDTPADDSSAAELIYYLRQRPWNIKAVIATHFHEDCVGGLATFNKSSIPAYASSKTIAALKKKGNVLFSSLKAFTNSLTLQAGHQKVYTSFMGEGHTRDNVIGYFAADRAMFGGCLIKAMGAGKGNLEDANVLAWPATVAKIKQQYPAVAIVIPGHGKTGGPVLLDYTMELFKK